MQFVPLSFFKIGNRLYHSAYPVYRPLYTLYKTISDRRERALCRELIKPGMVVVDVGANIGVYTRFFSRLVGPSGKVISFEPSPENFRRLSENVSGLRNVEMHEAAVGDTSGSISLFYCDELNVDHTTYDTGENRLRADVPSVTLDDLFPSGSRVDVLKIDVQGFEPAVIRGAQRLISENPQLKAIVEFWPYGLSRSKVAPGDFLASLDQMGLVYQTIGHETEDAYHLATAHQDNPDRYYNLLVNHQSSRPWPHSVDESREIGT